MAEAEKTEKLTAQIVSALPRSKEIPLDWPVEFDGKLYTSITVRRINTAAIRQYTELMIARDPQCVKFPTIDCPLEVFNALDADDAANVLEAAQSFLPRRLKSTLEEIGEQLESAQETGDSLPPS